MGVLTFQSRKNLLSGSCHQAWLPTIEETEKNRRSRHRLRRALRTGKNRKWHMIDRKHSPFVLNAAGNASTKYTFLHQLYLSYIISCFSIYLEGLSETLIRAWHMSDDECEHYGHWLVYIINATLNDLLNQYSATTNHNVKNIV